MLRRPMQLTVLSDSSEDEDVRLWSVDTRNTRNHIFSRATQTEGVNNGSSSALTIRKRPNKLPINRIDDSSGSELENTAQKIKRGSLRPLSDYDSGENCGPTGKHTGESSDSSSDFNVTRSGRKRHFNIVSSSDSSDSGMPVAFRRRSKRMRLISTSSDSSTEHSNNELSSVTNRPFSPNTSRRPTITATVTSNTIRQENVVGRRLPPPITNNNSGANNNGTRNNNSQAATIGSERSGNTSIARTNTRVRNRQSNLRSNFTNNSSVRGNSNSNSIMQTQRNYNNSRSRSNNSTSRTINRRSARSQNNPVMSRNLQVRPSFRVNRWDVTDTNMRTQNTLPTNDVFDTSSNDSGYFISPTNLFQFPLISTSSSSPSSTSSDSSSSDEIIPVRNRNRRNRSSRAIIESDEENDTNNLPLFEPEPEERNITSVSSRNVPRPTDAEKSNKKEKEHLSDSEGESDKCPICLASFKTQEIGTPKICNHSFCLACLQEWAKNNNTCPVDRKLFNSIVVRAEVQGQSLREIAVETPAVPGQFIESEDVWTSVAFHLGFSSEDDDSSFSSLISEGDGPDETCCVCSLSNRSDFMIVCDFCYNVYHLDCVDPPLQYVPAGGWNCPQCLVVEMHSYSDSSNDSDFIP